ncbi:hypothetical protein GCU60_02225 [Blastococcus saxobsidens]|uniref:Uncharacterized protein n=1 Tax=Blastococcus saxobsidens TaxID=138336 RepID=A0A6L9VYZ4_9ACTN|nr:hypothetical protein [Blastococcus saxobsidens]NEK84584.1 hypothetical protein [Blastococcus saxobsidens]
MTRARPAPITDDHGDQFPGAVPFSPAAPAAAASERLVRMHATYVQKVNSVVGAGRDDLVEELALSFAEESGDGRRTSASPDRRPAGRSRGGRGPGRVGGFTRRSLERFDRYTLEVFNAGTPTRPLD